MGRSKSSQGAKATSPPTVRCAIYTRKSTDEGLDQEFNSLDAQRESAEAYIASQKHEGWICLPERYDDGGFTGANMERPALQRMLKDVEDGKIDTCVVYKVDRISRSLMDFARLMETFETHGVSFVSVTQQFHSGTSMGRLTLNILLSFAQFEREIIVERTRDKIAAARKKGKWIGGIPILGYDVQDKKLVVNPNEAERVRGIFDLYVEHRAMMPVVEELDQRGWRTKQWTSKRSNRDHGGRPITKTSLYKMLTNVAYVGKVAHHDEVYEGEHDGIVSSEIFTLVQKSLKQNGRNGGRHVRNRYGALLRGLLKCVPCETSMVHTYTKKGGRRYRYYVCLNAQKRGWAVCPSKSLNAQEIEDAVVAQVRALARHPQMIMATLVEANRQMGARGEEIKREYASLRNELKQQHARVQALVEKTLKQPGGSLTDDLAQAQEGIRVLEQRSTLLREEMARISAETVDENDLARTLTSFDHIWNEFPPREKSRLVRMIVSEVQYDGRDESVKLVFRSSGINRLCEEAGARNRKEET